MIEGDDIRCPDCHLKLGEIDWQKSIEDMSGAIIYAVIRHGICPELGQTQCARVVDERRWLDDKSKETSDGRNQ